MRHDQVGLINQSVSIQEDIDVDWARAFRTVAYPAGIPLDLQAPLQQGFRFEQRSYLDYGIQEPGLVFKVSRFRGVKRSTPADGGFVLGEGGHRCPHLRLAITDI